MPPTRDDLRALLADRVGTRRSGPRPDDPRAVTLPADAVPVPRTMNVFLTGGTGFVGATTLAELVARPGVYVRALVRARDAAHAWERLEAAARTFELPPPDATRVGVVVGDIASSGFGLAPDVRAELARATDAVVHAAAETNWIRSYAELAKPNVEGTIEAVRFACAAGAPLHHVSSLGLLFAAERPRGAHIAEDDDIDRAMPTWSGYAQTKWTAERMVVEASRRGLATTRYRIGSVIGDRRTGAHLASEDFQFLLMRAVVALRARPDDDFRGQVEAVPVDVVARVIAARATDPNAIEPSRSPTLHVIGRAPLPLGAVFAAIERRMAAAGIEVEHVPFDAFRTRAAAAAMRAPDSDVARLAAFLGTPGLSLFDDFGALIEGRMFGRERFAAALDDAGVEDVSPDDAAILDRWCAYLERHGLLVIEPAAR